jgi:drug/metabolite transporter (DMT)-like permease
VSDRLDPRAAGLAVLLAAIWGGSYTMVKLGLRDLPVFGSLFLRVIVAAAVLGAYSLLLRLPLLYDRSARRFLLAVTVAFMSCQVLLYLGAAHTTASRASIFFNTQPFFTLLLLPLWSRHERVTTRKATGTAVAFAGIVAVFADRLATPASLAGDTLVLAAALCWSASTILNKVMPREIHPVSIVLWGVAASIPVMGLLTLLLEPSASWRLTPTAVASVLYLGAIAAAFSFVAFTWLIQRYSAIRVNAFVFLSPVFGVLIGWSVMGDPLSAGQALGALAVAGGIYVVNAGV